MTNDVNTPRASHRRAAVEASQLNDEELVEATRDGRSEALDELLVRYRRFARAKARSYFLAGGDREDVIQEGMIGLYKAVRDYRPEYGASFRSFAELCITRQILTAIKTATRQKHSALNTYISFERPQHGEDGRTVADSVAVEPAADPLAALVQSDQLDQLRELFDEVLSDLEAHVLQLYVEGRSYQEIAELLGRHVKSIDNALQRIKRKLEGHVRSILGATA
ncbi:MAG: RNA polymerase sporulation-specific sigma factor [Myxococcota bacterium]|jgi:RNA polymerase sporulation-specific sigma factor